MPGIFGIIDRSGGRSQRLHDELVGTLEQMAAAMRYDTGYVVDTLACPELGAYAGRAGWPQGAGDTGRKLGHVNVALLTAGEPVSETPIGARSSVDPGVDARGAGARDLLLAYATLGEVALPLVNGAFAGFLVDRRHSMCLLFNDRYGMERLFLHQAGDRTYFASEAKAILAVAPATRTFDAQALAQLLTCGCTLGSRSLFRDIEVVDGGTVIRFHRKGSSRRIYFDRTILENASPLPEERSIDALSESLRSAVSAAVRRPPAVGISLTGGLDSRMVMAHLDAPTGSVPCYTFGSMYRETFDVSVGRQVAERCAQRHQVIELGAQFLRDFPAHLEDAVRVSDGYLGLAGAAELYLNRIARSIAPVRITGNWGGELLRGVRAFKWIEPKGGFLGSELQQLLPEASAAFAAAEGSHPLTFTLFHHMPALGYGRYAIERSQVLMRAPFLDSGVVGCLYRTPLSIRTSSDCSAAIIKKGRAGLLAIPTDQGLLGRAPRSFGAVRRRYRQALAKGEYWTSHGAPDWIAALTASMPGSLIERGFRNRHKFHQFRLWLRTPLASFVQETIASGEKTLSAWFDLSRVRRLVNDHLEGRANYTNEIDSLLTVAIAGRTLLASRRPEPAGQLPARKQFVYQD